MFAFLGFLCLTSCLGSLTSQDSYLATLLDGLRGDQACPFTIWFTGAAPFLAATLVGVGALVARRRDAALVDVWLVLALLAVGLLLVEGLKLEVPPLRRDWRTVLRPGKERFKGRRTCA